MHVDLGRKARYEVYIGGGVRGPHPSHPNRVWGSMTKISLTPRPGTSAPLELSLGRRKIDPELPRPVTYNMRELIARRDCYTPSHGDYWVAQPFCLGRSPPNGFSALTTWTRSIYTRRLRHATLNVTLTALHIICRQFEFHLGSW